MGINDRRQRQSNSSTNITVGNITEAQVAMGKDVRAKQSITKIGNVSESAEQQIYEKAKNELLAAIKKNQSQIKEADELTGIVNNLDEEIQKEKPNKTMARALMEGLGSKLNKVASVALKANALQTAAETLLGLL